MITAGGGQLPGYIQRGGERPRPATQTCLNILDGGGDQELDSGTVAALHFTLRFKCKDKCGGRREGKGGSANIPELARGG